MGIRVVRQAVAADHREVVLHDALHVLFVHLEEDGAGGEEFLGGFFRGGVPLLGDVVEHAAGEFGMRDGPGDLHRHIGTQPRGHQHGGAGVVGIDIKRNFLALRGGFDARQGLGGAAVVLRHGAFVVADDHGRV